jgi:exopolysaccharide biosynthesis polyprenyl glycosylphosphotransferase
MKKMTEAKAKGRQWQKSHRTRVVLVDSIAVTAAVTIAQLGRFGTPPPNVPLANSGWLFVSACSAALVLIWIAALGLQDSWDLTLAGIGTEEYRRVCTATAQVFGTIAIADLLLQTGIARGYLAIALPLGLIGLLVGRYLLRRDLARKRAKGAFISQIVVLGNTSSVLAFCGTLSRCTTAGYRVVGACVPSFDGDMGYVLDTPIGPVPVLGNEHSVADAVRLTNADALAVASAEQLGHEHMRTLAWRLDELGIDMIVMPGMTDIASPRLKVRPIDNIPLFHIARPRHNRTSRLQKRCFDLLFGAVALVVFAPIMVVAVIAIKMHDGGPVFFRQERVGYGGRPFRIFKFRTMDMNAADRLDSERVGSAQADAIFYKSAEDSRITAPGRWLRMTSIDEIPQLLNVLAGSMSIVGPRPLVPGEGSAVQHFTERRALVKPGMTGLWQVCGRSDVSAEERIRLDHSYIDNWSYIQDMVIVVRTVGAVLDRRGAY